ncbi:MAG TPA: hypothetical protein QGH10_02610, partial [Armatimonadota bacterium]|nr:hypothetical protein [Armatimonadota bacterium]
VLATGLETAEDLGPGETGAAYVTELAALVMGAKANDGGIASFSVPGIRRYLPAQPKPRTSWEFRKDAEGWETQNDCNVNGQGGSLTVTTTGDDPYVASGPCEINATRFPQVKARVRLTGGGEVGLFWRSSGSPAWGPDKEVQARVKADGDWHEIAWDLGDHASWSGTITQLRLDVEGEETPAGTVLDVEWIRPAGE